MKANAIYIVFLFSFMLIIGPAPLTAQSESEAQVIEFYESCIQKKISSCNAKTLLKTSRSENLQRKANLSLRQALFIIKNKDMLIDEMLDQGIGYKHYKVEYYLNKRFFETEQ